LLLALLLLALLLLALLLLAVLALLLLALLLLAVLALHGGRPVLVLLSFCRFRLCFSKRYKRYEGFSGSRGWPP
jgi:hypothetical protein